MREFIDKQAMIDDLKRQCREVFRIDAVKPEDYYIKKDAKFMENTWTIWCESFYRYLGARTAFTEQEIVKPYFDKLKEQINEQIDGGLHNNDLSEVLDMIDKILSEQEKKE
jgi:hypothetical protein